jgi:cobalt-zinc-cadmium efflux system outer membrane protein
MPGMGPATGEAPMPGMSMPSPLEAAARRDEPQGPVLTLADLEALALRQNPTLVQARAQVDASMAKSFQAGLFPNPVMGYTTDQIGAEGTPGETQGFFIEQEIFRGGKLRLSRAKYLQEAQAADLQALAQLLRVVNGVRIAYFDVLAAHRHLEIQRHLLGNYEEMARTTRELVNVGQANRPELLQVQVSRQRRSVELAEAENDYRAAWEKLMTLLGACGPVRGALADTLEEESPPISFDEALVRIYETSPQLQAARAEAVRDEITVARERVQPTPNVFVRAVTGYNFEVNNQTAAIQIGINPPLWNRNQGTVREAMAEVARARAEVARLELTLRRDLAEVFADYETARAAVQVYRAETVPQAHEAFELLRASYHQRRAPWAEVVMAERAYSDVSEEYVEALRSLRTSEVQIRGLLLTGGLDEPPPPAGLGGHIDATPQPR